MKISLPKPAGVRLPSAIATLVHEMCHIYNNEVLNTQDCSRGGTYHNREFKKAAEAHGLNVTRSDKYGYSHTSPSDRLLEWCMTHDLREIELCRMDIERGSASGSHRRQRNSKTDSKPQLPLCVHKMRRSSEGRKKFKPRVRRLRKADAVSGVKEEAPWT